MSQNETSEQLQKLHDLIKDVNIAMLTTTAEDGALHARPMRTIEHEFDGTIWFFTDIQSGKVHEIEDDQQVNLAYASPDQNTFVSLAGRAIVTQDKAKIDELWKPLLKAWFPDGKDSENLALLKITVESAQYWDSPSSKVVRLFGLAKALATGANANLGENEKIDLSENS